MSHLIVLVTVFSIFLPALMLPGPDFIAVVRASMTRGTRTGLLTTVGVSLGLGLYATLSLVGLAAILVEYRWLTWLVRILGGGYLVYLGLRLLLTRPQPFDVEPDAPRHNARTPHPVIFGFLVTMTNPKAIVLFASVFATSVTASTPAWLMAVMVLLVVASAGVWYALVSIFMSSNAVIGRFRGAQHWIERAAGVCFVAIGGRILTDSRSPVMP
ncbi:MAG: LysE family translocator [Alphaproteobacteria bacterium]|nr:LysE family translocator [Alphaproteobacteria bacterium]